jgi:antitoxin MazE
MGTTTRIIRIGNSRGIRIPKVLLEQADLPEEVELQVESGRLVVTAAQAPRAGWADAAKQMHTSGGDQLLDQTYSSIFDDQEWEW